MAKAKINTEDAVKEVNALIDVFNNLVSTTNKVGGASSANFRKVETGLMALKNVSSQVDSSFKELENRYKNMSTSQKNYLTQTRNLKEQTKELNAQITKQQLELDKLSNKQDKVNSGFKNIFSSIKALIGAFGIINGIQIFASLISDAYKLTKQFDSLSFALNTVTQSAFDAAISERFLKEITQDFGVELVSTTERWVKFLAAAKQSKISLKDTEDIFRSVTKASSVLGLQTDELSGVYLALEQMMSKGKITTEELRRQLGERLPGAFGIMAAAVGVNVNELDAMLKKGELLSAEVLPKFAKALENAYNIETVESIETITSAQNRLTNTWENFVKSVTEGETWIGKSLNSIANGISKVLVLMSGSDTYYKNMFDVKTIEEGKRYAKQLRDLATEILDRKKSDENEFDAIDLEVRQAREARVELSLKNASEKERIIAQERLDKALMALTQYGIEREAIVKSIAEKEIGRISAAWEKQKEITNDAKKRMDENDTRENNTTYGIALSTLAKLEARLSYLRKLTEVTQKADFGEDKPKKAKVIREFELKEINDLNNEVKLASLNARKETNDALIADDKNSWAEKLEMIKDNTSIELDIAKIQQNESLAKAKKYYDDQLHDLAKAKADGKKIIGDETKWQLQLEDNLADAKTIANEEYNKKINAAKRKQVEEFIKITKLAEEEEVDISQDFFNKKVIAAKEDYNLSKKTKEDKAKLDKELTRISVEEANARIEILIKNAEALIALGGLTEDEIAAIKRNINDLKASMKEFVPVDDIKESLKKLSEILEFAKEFADELSNFSNAAFDRTIENINAEIEAEKNKYDKLIELAAGNNDEQVRLEKEKQAKLEVLEAERLRQEQRKAKFDKAFALTSIALNTAVAISKVLGQTGIFGLAAWIPIAALGAVQAATVLATPIPKYEDGLDKAKDDHVAMINDGRKQEFVERDGNILTTKNKNAIVQLKKGDTVHKDYDSMISSNDIFKNISRASMLTSLSNKNNDLDTKNLEQIFDSNFKNLNKDLKNGIRDGFKNVSIHNHTTYNMDWLKYKNNTL